MPSNKEKSHSRAPGKTSATISLSEEEKQRFTEAAARENRTLSNFVTNATAWYVKEQAADYGGKPSVTFSTAPAGAPAVGPGGKPCPRKGSKANPKAS